MFKRSPIQLLLNAAGKNLSLPSSISDLSQYELCHVSRKPRLLTSVAVLAIFRRIVGVEPGRCFSGVLILRP